MTARSKRRRDVNFLVGKRQRDLGRLLVVAIALAAAACGPVTEPPKPVAPASEWREFNGSWNAAGTRHTISLGAERRGSCGTWTTSYRRCGTIPSWRSS